MLADSPTLRAEIADVLRVGRRQHVDPHWLEAAHAFLAAPDAHAPLTWARLVRVSRAILLPAPRGSGLDTPRRAPVP
jgi:hypothetical protein